MVRHVRNLVVYQRLCALYVDICPLTKDWPREECFELASQVRRSSNSAPAQLAERYDDRHVKNQIEGVNRSRGEAAESVHHLHMARSRGFLSDEAFEALRDRYEECIRMLNGLERRLEKKLPPSERRWTGE
jgi:four helix bundle protein